MLTNHIKDQNGGRHSREEVAEASRKPKLFPRIERAHSKFSFSDTHAGASVLFFLFAPVFGGYSKRMKTHYTRLLLMMVLSFASMYALMYMMVDRFDNVFPNLNQFYMAAIMTAPMLVFELLLMGEMYENKMVKIGLVATGVVLLVVFSVLLRKQTGIGDEDFLKSMIPHHGGAVLMCNEASVRDQEIVELCRSIIASQQSEIDWMKAKLNQLEGK